VIGHRLRIGLAAAGILAVCLGAGAAPGLGQEKASTTPPQPEPPSLGTLAVPVDDPPARPKRKRPQRPSSPPPRRKRPDRARPDRARPDRKRAGRGRDDDGARTRPSAECGPEGRRPSDEEAGKPRIEQLPDDPRKRTSRQGAAREKERSSSEPKGNGKAKAKAETCPPKAKDERDGGKGKRKGGAKRRDRPRAAKPTVARADSKPSVADPSVTLADPGPARVGVPNFVIDKFRIPPFLLPIYKAAEAEYNIPWQVLAAVNEIETDYGRNLNVSTAGALGWMQFMPATWKAYGTDANGDGKRDPYNPVDAIFSAARYIKAAGGEKNIREGLFAYNRADWYVESVLLRAKVIGGMPSDLVGGLTELTQGRFPIAAKARYTNPTPRPTNNSAQSIEIFAQAGAPAVAVNDGIVKKIGQNRRLGRYLILEDWSGNRYIYSRLGRIARSYPTPREDRLAKPDQPADELALTARPDPKPTRAASAGRQRGGASGAGTGPKAAPAAATARSSAQPASPPRARPPTTVAKERLYANPTRPSAYGNGGREQVLAIEGDAGQSVYGAQMATVYGLDRDQVEFKAMREGAQLVAGTVLARVGGGSASRAPSMSFAIRPAGKRTPRIDPKPILDGWKLLESTAIYRATDRNPFVGPDALTPSLGQMLLMTKSQLARRVLADPRIDVYQCGRDDIRAGLVDKRVLVTLEWLSGAGLRPTVSSLKCGHSKYVAGGGRISDHWFGRAVDISAINGIAILGNQQDGGITDITIRKLLELRGALEPSQIISLRTYAGTDNTLALSNHDDHIHVGWSPPVDDEKPSQGIGLRPSQWPRLIERLGQIDNPTVPIRPTRYALPADRPRRKRRD